MKTIHRILALSCLTLLIFLLGSCTQNTSSYPAWFQPAIGSSHSILKEEQGISNRDFSGIINDKRQEFIGYLGEDYQKIEIQFNDVEKESATEYRVAGRSIIKENKYNFAGSIRLTDVRELNEYVYGADDFMKGKVKRQGICMAHYHFEEDSTQENSGTFSGTLLFRWYINNDNELKYDDIGEDSDHYSNNQFLGVRTNYSTHKEEKCAWGHYRIPDCGDLDIGAAEFSVNPLYEKNGWKSGKPTADDIRNLISLWSGTYSVEVEYPTTHDFDGSCITYTLVVGADKCIYHKSQLGSNESYECEVMEGTKDWIAFKEVENTPDADGKPLAILNKINGKFYLSGPYIADSNYDTDVLIEVDKKENNEPQESSATEYTYIHADEMIENCTHYDSYKIVSKEAGDHYCLLIDHTEYPISDMMDYGNLDMKVYKKDQSTLFLLGLVDLYASVYFVYLFKDDALTRLGDIEVTQPSDVEEQGVKDIYFKVYDKGDRVLIENYLDDALAGNDDIFAGEKEFIYQK